jgi:hypothetical protein
MYDMYNSKSTRMKSPVRNFRGAQKVKHDVYVSEMPCFAAALSKRLKSQMLVGLLFRL